MGQYGDIAKNLLFIIGWRPTRMHVRICFRSMYFAESMFCDPAEMYYVTDPEYICMSDADRAAFKQSLIKPNYEPSITIRGTTVIVNNVHSINIPISRFNALRELYLVRNMANVYHMYLCIAHVFIAYRFCKNYMMLLLSKYPTIARVGVYPQPYYSLYNIDMYFGSMGAFTKNAEIRGRTVYMPIAEIVPYLRDCYIITPDVNGAHSVELSDGRRLTKIYLSNIEYIASTDGSRGECECIVENEQEQEQE
jgi:hypothetical protein